MEKAIALLEVQALTAAIEGLDAMLKAANVRLVHVEKRLGGRLVTIVVDGTVSDVTAAEEKGKNRMRRGVSRAIRLLLKRPFEYCYDYKRL